MPETVKVMDHEKCQVTSSGHQTSHREGSTTEHPTPLRDNKHLVAAGRLRILPTGNVRERNAF